MVALGGKPVKRRRVAIIGSGPAGSTLACLLARAGADAVIFDDEKRPEMVVGESLVPRLVPVFRRLGIEEKVAALGVYKPGVTWSLNEMEALELSFTAMREVLPNYAYNVPRKEFDQLLSDTALESGARFIKCSAKLETATAADGTLVPRLSAESLALVPDWNGETPELLVDASGRRRLFAKLLGIAAEMGNRKDVSHFAHYQGCEEPKPAGQVFISRLEHGWSWRIPLPGKISVGAVVNREHAKKYGNTPEEQLEGIIDGTPELTKACVNRQRITPVATYANYQLISERGHGPGWVCVGDSFGFVDPMLSPGLCMAMTSAEQLADAILENKSQKAQERAFARYIARFREQLSAWQELIDYFYDGRIFALFKTGRSLSAKYPGKFSNFMERYMSRHIAGMAGGALTTSAYSRGLLSFMGRHGIKDFKAEDYAVR